MLTVSKSNQPNKFNGITFHIYIDSFFSIYILETNSSSFLIEIKEEKLFTTKTHISRISNQSLRETVILSFDYLMQVFSNHKNYGWSEIHKEKRLNEALASPAFYGYFINK